MAPNTSQHTHRHTLMFNLYLKKKTAIFVHLAVSPDLSQGNEPPCHPPHPHPSSTGMSSLEEKEYSACFNGVSSLSSSPLNTLFLPSLCQLHVICITLISVMGALVHSLHICLSLFTQRPCPGRIPSTGPRCRPSVAVASRERFS